MELRVVWRERAAFHGPGVCFTQFPFLLLSADGSTQFSYSVAEGFAVEHRDSQIADFRAAFRRARGVVVPNQSRAVVDPISYVLAVLAMRDGHLDSALRAQASAAAVANIFDLEQGGHFQIRFDQALRFSSK
jgi:hypothetical protein